MRIIIIIVVVVVTIIRVGTWITLPFIEITIISFAKSVIQAFEFYLIQPIIF